MQSIARRGAPVRCSPYGSRKTPVLPKGKLIKWKGGGVGVCAPGFEGLKIISAGKDGGREGVPDDKTVIISKNIILSMSTY